MRVRALLRAAVIAAVYVALCLLLAPISYGTVQVRVAEALTLLPVLCPEAVVGVSIGCFLANLFTGTPLDVLVGTLTTLLAALASRKLRAVRLRGVPLLAAIPPVLFNTLTIGPMLTALYYPPQSPWWVWVGNSLSVGAGQLISCCILGLPLVLFIEKRPSLYALFQH